MKNLILLASVLLCGCTTLNPFKWFKKDEPKQEEVVVRVQADGPKDDRIKKAEAIASDAASALIALSPTVPAGVPRGINDLTAERLSTLQKPSVASVEKYRAIIKNNDASAIEAERKRISKLSEELIRNQKEIDDLKTQLINEQVSYELIERKATRLSKDKTLWMFTCVGIVMFAGGVIGAALPMNPFKKNSIFIAIGGLVAVGFAWFVDAAWFPWVAGGFAGTTALIAIALIARYAWRLFVGATSPVNQDNKQG